MIGQPISSVISPAISSAVSASPARSRRSTSTRSGSGVVDQPEKAVRAAATARSTSATEAAGTAATGSSVTGEMTWICSLVDGVTHFPPMNSRS